MNTATTAQTGFLRAGDDLGARQRPARNYVVVKENGQPESYFVASSDTATIRQLPDGGVADLAVVARLNDVYHLNDYLRSIHAKLVEGGHYRGCAETAEQQRRRILAESNSFVAWVLIFVTFVFKRVVPKLHLTHRLYYWVTKGRCEVLTKTELLGRLIYCGFDIVDVQESGSELYFTVRRSRTPEARREPIYGPIFKMPRVGQGGAIIHVYKLRTMHPYAEYLQAYIYEQNKLAENGKFADDFRIAPWGRLLRRLWIDEVPMVVNMLRGELKLVGVRPLSQQYLGLYPPELAELRMRHKPGLVPPFYVDLPVTFDEILRSEEAYLRAYEERPRRTDLLYLRRAIANIVLRGARSG